MRKIIKISIAVICAGILLSGIGTGIAIAEYANLEYTGQHDLGEEYMKQESIDTVIMPVEGKKLMVLEYHRPADIVYDKSVPVNTIRYKVRYNPELVSVRVRYEEEEYEEEDYGDREALEEKRYQGSIRMDTYYFGSGFDLFMKNKDLILSELKQGKIGSYQVKDIENVEICMNPQMKDWVEVN